MKSVMAAAGGLVAALAVPAAVAQPQQIAFGDAIQRSLETRGIASARESVTAAERRASGTSAQRYPKLRAEANVLRWDSPIRIDLVGGGMPGAGDRLVVRERVTSMFSISLAQPISGLFVLGRMVGQERNVTNAAVADVARARLDAAQRAAEAYLRVLQAKALEEVASKSVAQIDAQLGRAVTLEKAGVMGKVDVLRWTSTRDVARQTLIRTQTNVEIARGVLAVAMDLPSDRRLDVADDLPEPPPPITASEAEVMQQAGKERPELRAAAERTEQARAGRTVALAQWLPNLMGVATYQHIEGQGPFQPPNAWYVGATLTWDIWDWGRTWDGMKEAGARARAAELAETTLREETVFEARRRLLEAKAAFETLAPARTALQAAEEAHRIQTVRYKEGVATTTDVIDTETELFRVRNGYSQARYDYYLSQAALARAVGRLPEITRASRRPD